MSRTTFLLCALMCPLFVFSESTSQLSARVDFLALVGESKNFENVSLAAKNATVEHVSSAILQGTEVNARMSHGWTPLMLISGFSQQPEISSALIEAGAKLEARTRYGTTALIFAAYSNIDASMVDVLVEAGAKLEARDAGGRTALIRAVWANKSPSIVSNLIAHGAEIDAINLNGWTPLMYAASGSSEEILRIVLDSGADMSARLPDETNRTAWDLVKDNSSLIDTIPWAMLLKGSISDIDIRDENGLTPLLRAVEAENMELVRFLVESGSNINARNRNTRTPISVAVSGINGTKIVEFLIESGADVNSSDSAKRTPLVWAIWTGSSVETVSLLIDSGANIETSNINGWTPLMYAVAGKKADTVQVILDRGSNVHATVSDGSGRTAWDIMQGNEYLRNTNAYWDLNDSRFP